jgi:hypothetical protein
MGGSLSLSGLRPNGSDQRKQSDLDNCWRLDRLRIGRHSRITGWLRAVARLRSAVCCAGVRMDQLAGWADIGRLVYRPVCPIESASD